MFPGTQTKLSEETVASAATIDVKADLVKLTGTTSIATIRPVFGGGFSGVIMVVPTGGNVATLTTGNISLAVTMPDERVTVLVYSKENDTWYPGAIS
jgi:hypothetical protein